MGAIKKNLLLVFALTTLTTLAYADNVTLSWDPVVHPDLGGYRLYASFTPGLYSQQMMQQVDANTTTFTWTGLDDTKQNYFVATAISIPLPPGNDYGEPEGTILESDYSNEVSIWGFPKPTVGRKP